MTRTTTTRHKPALSGSVMDGSQAARSRRPRALPIWFVVLSCSLVLTYSFGKWLIYPARNTTGSSAAALTVDFRVDVNHADVVTLAGLPGLGMVTGQLIIDHRQKHGRFSEPAQLMQVKGIGPGKLKELAPWIYCGQGVAPMITQADDQPTHHHSAATQPASLPLDSASSSNKLKRSTQKNGGPIKEPPLVEDSVMSVELTQ